MPRLRARNGRTRTSPRWSTGASRCSTDDRLPGHLDDGRRGPARDGGRCRLHREIGKPIAGKTGNDNDEKDVWFVGFSPDMAVGVYSATTSRAISQSRDRRRHRAPIVKDFLRPRSPKSGVPFRVPPGIKLIRIDPKSGMRSRRARRRVLEAFKPGTAAPDSYSIIGYGDPDQRSMGVTPEADRAVGRGGAFTSRRISAFGGPAAFSRRPFLSTA